MTNTKGPPKELRDVERTFVQVVMFEVGIVPMEKTGLDMRRALKQVEPDEARKLRRKFRKVWRKAAAAAVAQGSLPTAAAKSKLGMGKKVPSRAERNARKQLVFDELWTSVIGPMVQRFDNAGKEVTDERAPKKARPPKAPKTS